MSDIQDYIQKQRAAGVKDAVIQKAMIDTGWDKDQVSRVFSGDSTGDFGESLLGPGELLSRSFGVLKSRFWTLVGIQLLPTLIGFVFALLIGGGIVGWNALGLGNNIGVIVVVAIIGLAAVLFAVYISLWAQVAMFQAILNAEEKIGFKEAFKRSKGKIGQFFWVSALESLAITGGFLLFIIPGIIFSVWFMFGNIIYVDQGVKGIAALSKSREYARGVWWKIVGRMVVFGLISMGIYIGFGLVLALVGGIVGEESEILTNVLSQVGGLIVTPLFTIYAVQLYNNLKAVKGSVSVSGTGWIKAWAVWGVVGLILIPVGLLFLIVAINPAEKLKEAAESQLLKQDEKSALDGGFVNPVAQARDAARKADLNAIRTGLEMYRSENGEYPSTLQELAPNYIAEVPQDPKTQADYTYTVQSDSYSVCGTFETMQPLTQCVTSELPLE